MDATVRGTARYLVGVTAFSLAYATLAWLGYQLVPGVAGVTPIWFPAALALTVLLIHGLHYWPGAFLGPLLFSQLIGIPLPVALISCLGNLVGAALGAALLLRTGFDPGLSRFRDGIGLIFLGAVVPTLIGAAIGGISLYLGGLATLAEFPRILLFWVLSDTDGALVLTPLLLAAFGHAPNMDYRARWQELLSLGVCALLVATLVYGYYGLNPGNPLPTYLMFPLAVWAVLRFDAVVVGAVLFGAVAFGVSATVSAGQPEDVLYAQLLQLQTFIGVLAATCILIGSLRRQDEAARARADALAQREHDELEVMVRERTTELQAANSELAAFNRAVSHDLRTPLNGFTGLLDLLDLELRDTATPKVRLYLDNLRLSADAMSAMITALLNLSLSQRHALAMSRVDLSALCHHALAAHTPPAGLRIEIEPGMTAYGDPVLLQVLVQNLLDNALKYSAPVAHPHIRVHAQREGDRRWIRFEDNGIGFGAESPADLFEPFHRLTNAQNIRGSGIGLATVRHIVERHGGIVRAEPCNGGGACFAVSLPEP